MSTSKPHSHSHSRANSRGNSRTNSFGAGQDVPGIAQFQLRPGSIQINVKEAFIVEDDDDYEDDHPDSDESSPICREGRLTPPDTKDIALPHHTSQVSHISIDIGGSLTKIVYFTKDENRNSSQQQHDVKGGRLNFAKFETAEINQCLEFLEKLINQRKNSDSPMKRIMATGGGSYKFYDLIRERLGVEVHQEDEMECLISGLDFFITQIPEEVFCYSEQDPMFFPERPSIYPCLLVNIGSGVSMNKVYGPGNFTRVGGSSIGGGTLWGLLSLLTEAQSFDEMLDMAYEGDNANVDMLVGDIYGTDYSRIGLKASTIASSFGKVFKQASRCDNSAEKAKLFQGSDISKSLLYAISNNIGQIAYLQAQNHGVENIYFSGSYIRGHPQTMNTLSYAIKFWSKGEKTAYFLRHEGYLGAVGAFIKQQPSDWMSNSAVVEG